MVHHFKEIEYNVKIFSCSIYSPLSCLVPLTNILPILFSCLFLEILLFRKIPVTAALYMVDVSHTVVHLFFFFFSSAKTAKEMIYCTRYIQPQLRRELVHSYHRSRAKGQKGRL